MRKKQRFKDKRLNKVYNMMVGKSLWEIARLYVGSTLYYAFKRGYEGKPKSLTTKLGTLRYAAFVAGKETKK